MFTCIVECPDGTIYTGKTHKQDIEGINKIVNIFCETMINNRLYLFMDTIKTSFYYISSDRILCLFNYYSNKLSKNSNLQSFLIKALTNRYNSLKEGDINNEKYNG